MPMTWGCNIDEQEGQRGFAKRESRLEEPSSRRERRIFDICWFRTAVEETIEVLGETIAVLEGTENGTCTIMYDTLSEGNNNNNDHVRYIV